MELKIKFCDALAKYGNATQAAKAVKSSRASAYRHREEDPEFAVMWDEALERAADVLEAEAHRRAVKGVKKPVYQGGVLVGHVQVYSDSLMQTLLKAARPDKFKDRVQSETSSVSEVKITRTIKR